MLDTIGVDGVLKLLKDVDNRKAAFRECLVYYDGIEMKYFYGVSEGTIAEEKVVLENASQWSPLWSIFIPKNCDKTLVEMTEEERANRHDEHTSPFTEFNQYLNGKQRVRTK